MKRNSVLVLILITTLAIVSAFSYNNRGVQAVSIKVNVKDLPEHGLIIIGPSDSSFEDKVSTLLRGKPNDFVEALKPFSAFVKNAGNKAVVGYWLKWEIVKADGGTVIRETGGVNPNALMHGGPSGMEHLSTSGGYAIRPNSSRFVSPGFSLGEEYENNGVSAIPGGSASTDHNTTNQLRQMARDRDVEPILDSITADLQEQESITVSIDGVFFEDGTFVGPDSTNFFAKVQACIDAKRDLLEEIAFAISRKQGNGQIFKDIEELSSKPAFVLNPRPTMTDYYNYYKRIYADEIMHMRRAIGDDKAIALSLQPLGKAWRKLRKE